MAWGTSSGSLLDPGVTPTIESSTMSVMTAFLAWAGLSAAAAPPLVFVMDTAEPGLRAWWREGDLLLAPKEGDPRPAIRPLAGKASVVVPADMTGWTALGETCNDNPHVDVDLDGVAAQVVAEGPWAEPKVRLLVGERVLAQARLGRPARLCDAHAGQLDGLPGPEVVVAWRFGDGDEEVRGITVFRIPDTAR